jgi:hypothetical protein
MALIISEEVLGSQAAWTRRAPEPSNDRQIIPLIFIHDRAGARLRSIELQLPQIIFLPPSFLVSDVLPLSLIHQRLSGKD